MSSRTVTSLKEQEKVLRDTHEEIARLAALQSEAIAKARRIQKMVDRLRVKDQKELKQAMEELDAEGESVESSVETTEPAEPREAPGVVSEVSLESMSPGTFARWVDTADPALFVGEFGRDYSVS